MLHIYFMTSVKRYSTREVLEYFYAHPFVREAVAEGTRITQNRTGVYFNRGYDFACAARCQVPLARVALKDWAGLKLWSTIKTLITTSLGYPRKRKHALRTAMRLRVIGS